jgi:hypothetical protein
MSSKYKADKKKQKQRDKKKQGKQDAYNDKLDRQ